MTQWIEQAKHLGFDTAVSLDPRILVPRSDVRAMCADNRCNLYGKNWGCPPFCGSVEECADKIHTYHRGILLQTVGHMQKAIDSRAYRETEQLHLQRFHALCQQVRAKHPDALCLGAGGCRVCQKCAWPESCRLPNQAVSSMEGYGLFVTQVCRDCGIDYHHGEKTVTYTACILF